MSGDGARRSFPCRGVLFDMDGVLVDSLEAVSDAWGRWAGEHGFDAEQIIAMVHGRRSQDTVAQLVPEAEVAEALERIDRYEIEAAGASHAIAGAADLLASLPDGAWTVVTSARRDLAEARLRGAGLPMPATLISAQDVTAGKPDPQGYRAGAKSLGLSGDDCVVLEDAKDGITAGRGAGAAVIGVGEAARQYGADAVVADLREVRWDGSGLVVVSPDA